MHRLIPEDQEVEAFSAFAVAHGTHLMSTDIRRGTWSLVMHCPRCHDWQAYQIDNYERRKALRVAIGKPEGVPESVW